MKQRAFIFVVLLLTIVCGGNKVFSATITWNGTISSDWRNPTNWIPQQIPTAADHVVFNSGNLTAPTNGAFAIMDWNGGNLYGAITVANGAVLNVGGAATHALFGPLTNAGTVTVTCTSFLQPYYIPGSGYFGAIYNLSGGLFDIQNDQFYLYYASGNEVFNNAGTLRKSGGTGTTQIYPRLGNTSGLIDAETGTLAFLGGGVIDGQYHAASGATVTFTGGSYTDGGVSQFTGAGSFKFESGTLTLLNNVIPNLQMLGGTLVLGPAFQGGSITNLTVLGINMQFTNTVIVTGVFNWTAGGLSGALTVANGAVLNLGGAATHALFGPLTNAGTVTVTCTSFLQPYYIPGSGYFGAIYNLPGGLFDIQNDQFYLYYATGNEVFNNAGTLRKSGGTGTTQIYSRLGNTTGLIDAETGTLAFLGGGVIAGQFHSASGATVTFTGGSYTDGGVSQFTGPGAFKFESGTLTLLNNVIPNLQMLGGTLVLGPAFQGGSITNLTVSGIGMQFTNTVTGVFNWTAGNLFGALTVSNGAVLNLSGAATHALFGPLTNAGTVTVTCTSFLQPYYIPGSGYFGAIYNLSGGLFDIQNDQFYLYYASGNEVFNNAGTLRKSGGTGTTQIYPRLGNTSGLIDAETGTLAFLGGGVIDGQYHAASGATVTFTGGSYADGGVSQFTGAGSFKFESGTLTLLNNMIPNLQMLGGTLVLGPAFQGGSITNLTVLGINMQFTNTVIVTGVFNWTAGGLSGALTVANGAVLNLGGAATHALFGPLTNAGTVTVTCTSFLQPYYIPGSGYFGAIYNLSGGLFDIQNDQFYLYYASGNEVFNNAGTLRKSGGTGVTQIYSQLMNTTGLIDVQTGTISLIGSFTPGSGELRCRITSLSNYGKIAISGNATLGGTVGAVLFGGYVPTLNSSFGLVTYGSHTGIFAGLDLPATLQWSTNYTATTFTVTVSGTNNIALFEAGHWVTNRFQLTVSGANGSNNTVIYASTNLVFWSPIYTNPPTNGIIQFFDNDATNYRARFYRSAEQ